MDNVYEVRARAKKFNSKLSGRTLWTILPISIVFLIIVTEFDKLWLNILFLIFFFIALVMVVIYIGRKQRAVLLYDMDPQLYYAILHQGDVIKIGTDPDIEIFYFAGDYQKAIDSANAMIEKFNTKGKKYSNLNILNLLACAYFEIGDYENATKTIDYIKTLAEELKLNNKKGYTQVILPQLEYIENFIKCDFVKCLEIENMLTAKIKRSNTFIARNKYYTALAKYYLGDTADAKQRFEELLYFCPKLNYSNLAQQYLDAIQNNEIMTLTKLDTDFKYNGNIIEPDPKKVKKSRRIRIVALVLALFSILLSLITSIIFSDDDQNMNDDYSNSISVEFDILQE